MTTQSCNPLTARLWFRLREPVNWVIAILLFAVGYFLLMPLVGGFVAWIICVGAAFCLFFGLQKRPIGIRCTNCRKFLKTNTPWVCGFKQCRNDQTDDFPFVNRCQHCEAEPKAYKCHHCGELIYFTEDRQPI